LGPPRGVGLKTKSSRLTRSVLSEQFSALVIDLLVPQTEVADGPGDTENAALEFWPVQA